MKYIRLIVLFLTVVIFVSSCDVSTGTAYIPQAWDSISNSKNDMDLKGKVKTMDIYYFYPKSETSLFKPKFSKGEKWEYRGNHRVQLVFN